MKKELFASAVAFGLALGVVSAPAFADELEDKCVAYSEENGGDPSGCACLGESAEGEARDELLTVNTPEDIEALSDDAKEAIATCFPDA